MGNSQAKPTVVIPAAGVTANELGSVQPKAMLPVLGRPVILYILHRLISSGFSNFVIIEPAIAPLISPLVKFVYGHNRNIQIDFAIQDKLSGPLSTILRAEEFVKTSDMLLHLADTLCKDSWDFNSSFCLVSEVIDSYRWCIAEADSSGSLKNLFDKQEKTNIPEPHQALIGVYYFSDSNVFFSSGRAVIKSGPAHTGLFEISQAINIYKEKNSIKLRSATNWIDFGNQDMLLSSLGELLAPRAFNHLQYDRELSVLTKRSLSAVADSEYTPTSPPNESYLACKSFGDISTMEKLRNEIHWYSEIPKKCRRFVPQVVDYSVDRHNTFLSLDFVPFDTLGSSYIFKRLPLQRWINILDRVLSVFENHFWSVNVDVPGVREIVQNQLLGKTQQRLAAYPDFLPKNSRILLNDTELLSLEEVVLAIEDVLQSFAKDLTSLQIVHGDLCFSNILFDIRSNLFKVVDPRGSFDQAGPSIYGHYSYDLAKLRHSIAGRYDSIVHDLFHIFRAKDPTTFQLQIHSSDIRTALCEYFDRWVSNHGINPLVVKAIEASLFLSMVPLHFDKPDRQLAFYLIGLERGTEVSKEASN